jgi:DNA-cytosine methyltransferase
VACDIAPIDLAGKKALECVAADVRDAGGVDVLIGGPPCQGFSSANRNSWSSNNPHNRLVNVFLRYVEKLSPPVFLMENVQGIVWTARDGSADARPSVAEHVLKRMKSAGYLVFPKLLDAVWYGVPQYRTRFFVLGIHKDIGYKPDDFGAWGPFPFPTHGPGTDQPYVTVREAIGDLPAVGNGNAPDEISYLEQAQQSPYLRLMRRHAPKYVITDHVTSNHAAYVIERYKRIPAGGNWEDILPMMSNYAHVERTHSNIYRRLSWGQPSITIGHYRKSMLVHPRQHRGLSLREATRLQSFPDWFRFAGAVDGIEGGLMHKQQQLANAVCPLVTKAVAEFILGI